MFQKEICILMGSPRKSGNTASLLKPFIRRLEEKGGRCRQIELYDMILEPCLACRACQVDWTVFGCARKDDMQYIFDQVLTSDMLVLATPIYSWYCTPPMKAVLDRLVYGMNKYYGEERGPALWAGKPLALMTTCGYRPQVGADLWEAGVQRYCKHSQLRYLGMLAERHLGYQSVFMDAEKEQHAGQFADLLLEQM